MRGRWMGREREGREKEERVDVQENGYLFPLVPALLFGPTGSLKMLFNKLKLWGGREGYPMF